MVLINTSKGDIRLKLDEENTPKTAANFLAYVRSGFYKDTLFHRVIPGFMVQGGDPLSKEDSKKAMWGTGGPGYKIKDEFYPEYSNTKGTIAMANAGPNTGGSQFFINLVPNTFLDGKHPVFGKVIEGMQIVEKIGKIDRDSQDKPLEAVIIKSVKVE